jgi:hypothetical protein
MLEQHGVSYLPLDSVSMQERVRAVEFVLGRCGIAMPQAKPRRAQTLPPSIGSPADAPPALRASIDSWPYALVDSGDHEA